ncbi:MAG: hypothetical protein ACI8PZ_000944 [Myxococcota bacterium]|jgi:hypothetical protein
MPDTGVSETLIEQGGVRWVAVDDVDRLPPFLVSVVSPGEHWLYTSSAGGLACGRIDAERSLFPYQTDDRLHRAHHDQGPWTCMHVVAGDGTAHTWEPFRPRNTGSVRRHLRKSVGGDQVVFIEEHLRLGLEFRYRWAFSDRFGLVRTATLRHVAGPAPRSVRVIDGLQGVLPANAPLSLVQTSSCLIDAYTRTEWDAAGDLALITLEAQPSDRAEPAESLRATVLWCEGLDARAVLLSRDQLDDLARGEPSRPEARVVGRPGALLVDASVSLAPGGSHTWHIVADVGRSHADVAALRSRPRAGLGALLEAEVRASTAELDGVLADADGLQRTGNAVYDAHVRACALFNCMRGGLPVDEQRVSITWFADFVGVRNRDCRARQQAWFADRSEASLEREALVAQAEATGDVVLIRLAREVLPLWFSRRHGDPSRPWNKFSVRVRRPDGGRQVAWEGNWRDVFQNWEATLHSTPAFFESAIACFVNASTRDGHNPYRITSEGVDWELPDPEDPWSNIGYWGDHQVAYLTRLLEAANRHDPGGLVSLLTRPIFAYADVPYRLAPYASLLRDPRDSIGFDDGAQRRVEARMERLGQEGRLVADGDAVLHVTLAEKLVVPVLAKLCNLVPGAGIWLNTQRPEWNDANNALAGFGVSVVTAAWLRRHLGVLDGLFASIEGPVRLTAPVARWLDAVLSVLQGEAPVLSRLDDYERRRLLDRLGAAYGVYRAEVYSEPAVTWSDRLAAELRAMCVEGRVWLDHALGCARRDDGLYDGYDLLNLGDGTASVERLYPMLEGQVAVLSSGWLSPAASADLVERLYDSPLYREDLDSFMLYPNRRLPSFHERNQVVESAAVAVGFVRAQLDGAGSRVILRDGEGVLRFAPDLSTAEDLEQALDAAGASPGDRAAVLALWEATFDHHAFTGRSGTMYAYEGLGSVYWHMVGKLLLAVHECAIAAEQGPPSPALVTRLRAARRRIRDGLGWGRSAHDVGAIPTDPHSHTPMGRGAQQPGMTGVVKEELLVRRGELGVVVDRGCLRFVPERIDPAEFVSTPSTWEVPGGVRPGQAVEVPAGGLAFLLCGLPVVVAPGPTLSAELHALDGVQQFPDARLDRAASQRLFSRDAALRRIVVTCPESSTTAHAAAGATP